MKYIRTIHRKTPIVKTLLVFYLLALFVACQNLLEQDISDRTVVLNSPPDQLHSQNYTQTFWWSEVDGASSYNLQVVSPSFDYMERLVLDTNVNENQFTYSFYPDTFTWRVKAINPASETSYAYATFYIDSTEGPQIPVLNKPGNNEITKDSTISFSWFASTNASNYRILIKEGEDIVSSLIVYETSIAYPDKVLGTQLLDDGDYTWTIKAENEVGQSDYASVRNLTVDRELPTTPEIQKPKAYDTIDNFELTWKRGINLGTIITDSLIVYKDSSGVKELLNLKTVDTVYNYSGATAGWYRFKVKSVDAAGNQSEWSGIRYFYFKEAIESKN
jgi:hypothetical protein